MTQFLIKRFLILAVCWKNFFEESQEAIVFKQYAMFLFFLYFNFRGATTFQGRAPSCLPPPLTESQLLCRTVLYFQFPTSSRHGFLLVLGFHWKLTCNRSIFLLFFIVVTSVNFRLVLCESFTSHEIFSSLLFSLPLPGRLLVEQKPSARYNEDPAQS